MKLHNIKYKLKKKKERKKMYARRELQKIAARRVRNPRILKAKNHESALNVLRLRCTFRTCTHPSDALRQCLNRRQ